MDADGDETATPIGSRRVSAFVGGLGPATLEHLTGERMPVEAAPTPMIGRVSRAWATPLDELTCEQLRLLVGQGMAPNRLIGPTLALLRLRPRAQATFYPGDVAHALLRHAADALARDPDGARAFLEGDFGWIDDLPDRRSRAECADLLAAARRRAAEELDAAKPARSRHGRHPRPRPLRRRPGARDRGGAG